MDDHITEAERQLTRISLYRKALKASEEWSPDYQLDPASLVKLLRLETKLEKDLRRYLRELAIRAEHYVDWMEYERKRTEIKAAKDDFDVSVLVTETLDDEDGIILNIMYDPVASGVALGAQASEAIYGLYLGVTDATLEIQRATKGIVAELVGKKLTKDGRIIDNPKAERSINETTRKQIKEAVATSLTLGEDYKTAVARMQRVIKDPKRAELIAQTESVNAYQTGVYEFALMSGAVGKEWRDVRAVDVCHAYATAGGDRGYVKLDHQYAPGLTRPPAHPRCRCSLRLVYPEELEQ